MVLVVLKLVHAELAQLLRLTEAALESLFKCFGIAACNGLVEIDLSVICILTGG